MEFSGSTTNLTSWKRWVIDMVKNNEAKFSQHLFLMGDKFDDRVTQWFKGAIIIEHDLSVMDRGGKLETLMQICRVTMGHKITKITEVIGGSEKGLTLARLSGTYPVAISQNSAYERGLITRLVTIVMVVRGMNRRHSDYSDCLSELRSCAHGLKGGAVATIQKFQNSSQQLNQDIGDLMDGIVKQNFRRLLV